jgi:hypothetical protein
MFWKRNVWNKHCKMTWSFNDKTQASQLTLLKEKLTYWCEPEVAENFTNNAPYTSQDGVWRQKDCQFCHTVYEWITENAKKWNDQRDIYEKDKMTYGFLPVRCWTSQTNSSINDKSLRKGKVLLHAVLKYRYGQTTWHVWLHNSSKPMVVTLIVQNTYDLKKWTKHNTLLKQIFKAQLEHSHNSHHRLKCMTLTANLKWNPTKMFSTRCGQNVYSDYYKLLIMVAHTPSSLPISIQTVTDN